MIVFILERVPATVRGELSRWLIEPRHGVFLGTVSAMVRDRLWDMVSEKLNGGGALLVYSSPNEQGFKARATGDTTRSLRDCEGLLMVHIPTEQAKKKVKLRNPIAPGRARVRLSPDIVDEIMVEADSISRGVAGAAAETSKRSAKGSTRRSSPPRIRPLGKTHPLYGPQGPADAAEIALHCHDLGLYGGEEIETFLAEHDPALAVVGVRWRSVAAKGMFDD